MTINDSLLFHHRDVEADRGVLYQIFVGRDYALDGLLRHNDIRRFYDACDDPLIVDCGANIGASAVWFSLSFPKARIVAVEPEKHNFGLFERNVSEFENVSALRAAISRKGGTIPLGDPGSGEWGYRADPTFVGKSIDSVRAYTLRELVDLRGGTPFILKIDIEGAEADLFQSEDAIFDDFPLLIIELHDWKYPKKSNSQSFLRWHSRHDRDFVYRGENIFSIAARI